MRYASYYRALPTEPWFYGISGSDFLQVLAHASYLKEYLREQGFPDAETLVYQVLGTRELYFSFDAPPGSWRVMIQPDPVDSAQILLFSKVRLRTPYPERGLLQGEVGIIVEIWSPGVFEVEFHPAPFHAPLYATLRQESLELLS